LTGAVETQEMKDAGEKAYSEALEDAVQVHPLILPHHTTSSPYAIASS
jgi:hypothetical protein